MNLRRVVSVCLTLLLSLAVRAASTPESVRIEIKSSWGGLGKPSTGYLVITGARGKYSSAGKHLDRRPVESFLSALQQPLVENPSLEQCGISQQWLLSNFKQAIEDNKHERIEKLPPKAVELFKGRFTDVSTAQTAFADLFKGWHTDDYPEMSVTVNMDGKELSIQSKSQHPFMLPWWGTDQPRGGYNCKISQALAALLPKNFSNRERLLLNHGFRWELAQHVMNSIEADWNLFDTEFKVGPDVAPIFARFRPLKSAISNLSSVDLDGGQAWNAELRSSELPQNLVVGVSLKYHKGKLLGANEFLERIGKYSDLVLSVPWLSRYLQGHPETDFELRYVDGISLSPKAQRSLADDLRTHQKPALASLVAQKGNESAFVEINDGSGCWSRAIVLPTKEVLLWHFKCDSALGFPATNFDTWDYYGWRSTGTVINADGKLAN